MSAPTTDDLFPLVYAELRRLAAAYLRRERPGMTLQPTALVHEAYLQLSSNKQVVWQNRQHFLATAAIAMRQVLALQARRRKTAKRTPGIAVCQMDADMADPLLWDYDELDQALDRLENEAPELCRVVEIRYFGGMSVEEAAAHLNLSPRTVKRHWMLAKAWLTKELTRESKRDLGAGRFV
ncbi:MAG: ECF-type sigma factor [Bryobacteraceae bacterium]|jgi:RNA polymerase sigma factor (TIGR02999 family)